MSVPSREREQGRSGSLSFENSRTRAYDGAIVTFINTETGELKPVHRAGYSYELWSGRKDNRDTKHGKRERHGLHFMDVMTRLMKEADGWEGDWKVVTICTPSSIYADLARPGRPPKEQHPPHYEASMLQKIGRIDMWYGTYAAPHDERRRRTRPDREGE